MKNAELRQYAKDQGVFLWEVGKKFGVGDFSFSRWLRDEFPEEKKNKAMRFIDEIAEEHKKEVTA